MRRSARPTRRVASNDGVPRPIDVARLPTPVTPAVDAQRSDSQRHRTAITSTVRGCTSDRPGCSAVTIPRRQTSAAAPVVCRRPTCTSKQSSQNHNSQTPRTPSQTVRRCMSSTNRRRRCRSPVSNELKDRLEPLRLQMDDVSLNSATVGQLGDIILDKLTASYPDSFHWEIFNSGSYYDKTKVESVNFSVC